MLKLSDVQKVSIEFLEANIAGVKIEEGKYNELPSVAPSVWVYVEPTRSVSDSINNPLFRKALVTFFAVEDASVNKTAAANKSIQLIENVEFQVFKQIGLETFLRAHPLNINADATILTYGDDDQPLKFDSIYADFAVSYLEVFINYAAYFE